MSGIHVHTMGSRSASELCADLLYLLICGSVGLYSLLVQLAGFDISYHLCGYASHCMFTSQKPNLFGGVRVQNFFEFALVRKHSHGFSCMVHLQSLGNMAGFFSKLIPIHVDGGPDWHHPPCIAESPPLHNLLLLLLFTVPHSAALRGPVKKLLRFVISERYYKTFYVWISTNLLVAAMYFWQPMTTIVWSVPSQVPLLHNVITGLSVLCWLVVVISFMTLDTIALFGIKDPLFNLMRWPAPKPQLVQTGVYGLVRHPVYTFLMLHMWITPTMTVGHLLVASVLSLYTVLATLCYEEPELVNLFGQDYVRYMEKTPCFFPLPSCGGRQEKKTE